MKKTALNNNEIATEIALKYLKALKKRQINVISAYIFGSYAKGIPDKWSDIDLALIVNNYIGDEFNFQTILNKIIIETKLYDIEVHPFLADEFDDSNPFALEILKTGKRLI